MPSYANRNDGKRSNQGHWETVMDFRCMNLELEKERIQEDSWTEGLSKSENIEEMDA